MQVRMVRKVSGSRNGVEWPEVGGVLDVGDGEAADLVAVGLAVLVADVETAVSNPDGETATLKRAPRKAR